MSSTLHGRRCGWREPYVPNTRSVEVIESRNGQFIPSFESTSKCFNPVAQRSPPHVKRRCKIKFSEKE